MDPRDEIIRVPNRKGSPHALETSLNQPFKSPFNASFKAVFFDHDGTLVDSEVVHMAIWQEVLARYDAVLSNEFYADECAGVPTSQTAVVFIEKFKLSLNPAELIMIKREAEALRLARSPYPLMPHTREIVRLFAEQKKTLAVVTGAPTHAAQHSLHAHGLHTYIPRVFSGQDTPRNKPAPDCYLLAMEQLGLKPHECIAFEDTEHGLHAAADANIACFAVPHALSKGQDFSRATAIFSSFEEAMSALSA
jgi:HAD superfamily hydrolase (TIGR01509 family)